MKYKTLDERLSENKDNINEMDVRRDKKEKIVFGAKRNFDFENFLFIQKNFKIRETHWGNEYYFTHEYNPKSERYEDFDNFREMLKNGELKKHYEEDYDRFLEHPVEYLAKRTTLYHLDAVFYPQSQTSLFNDLIDKIKFYNSEFASIVSHKFTATFEMLKNNWENVNFDDKGYKQWLITDMKYSEDKAEFEREISTKKFNSLKKNNKNTWFQMKGIVPRDMRPFVKNFFYFNDNQLNQFKNLDAQEIFIIDDILTTGSTTDEISRMLRGINSSCKIIRFILIDMG